VRPELAVGGHYHQHIDTREEFTGADGQPFDSRSVVLAHNGHWPFVVILDIADLAITWPEPGSRIDFEPGA